MAFIMPTGKTPKAYLLKPTLKLRKLRMLRITAIIYHPSAGTNQYHYMKEKLKRLSCWKKRI
jgi:hypothetical protein